LDIERHGVLLMIGSTVDVTTTAITHTLTIETLLAQMYIKKEQIMKKLLILLALIVGLISQESYASLSSDIHHAASSASSGAHHVESDAQKAADALHAKSEWLAAHVQSGDCKCCPGGEWKIDYDQPVNQTIKVDNPAYKTCKKALKKAQEPYNQCQTKKKHIENEFKKLKVSPDQVKEAVTHDVTTGVAQAYAHATTVVKEAPGKAKQLISDAQAAPGNVLKEAKAIIKALPKTPHQALADAKKAAQEALVTGEDILKDVVIAEHAATQCHCTFLKWPNQKDITTLQGIRSHLYTWPQKGYKPTEKAKYCGQHTSMGYTVSYNTTKDQIQKAFKKAVGKALNKSQAMLNSVSQTLADAEGKLAVAQVKLAHTKQKLDDAATPITTEIATLKGDQTKITAGLKKIDPIKTLLLSLVPSDSAIIKNIGKHELSTDDITKLKSDVASICTLLVMFQSITQQKATTLQAAIPKALLAANKMLDARAKITIALAKLKPALKKVKSAVASGKIALQKSQATLTAAQNTVDAGHTSLEKSLQTINKTVDIMKHVMGIDIALQSHIVPLDQIAKQKAM